MAMSLAQQFTGLRCCSPLSSSPLSKPFSAPNNHKRNPLPIVASVALSNAQTKERQNLKQPFEDAYERCRTVPMEGVSFTLEEFDSALDKYDFDSEIGTKAEEMAQTFRQRIAQAEAMARADMLRFQPESGLTLSSDGILGPFF